jgi:hypothetical protein
MSYVVSATRVIEADAAAIFDLLADPSRHVEIDGSGTVIGARADAPKRLALGAEFGMSMKVGVPYKIENTVVEFEENRRIAWRHFGGHVWRYVLEPGPHPNSTTVTESFDWTGAKSRLFLVLAGYPKRNKRSMEQTLDRLAEKFAK